MKLYGSGNDILDLENLKTERCGGVCTRSYSAHAKHTTQITLDRLMQVPDESPEESLDIMESCKTVALTQFMPQNTRNLFDNTTSENGNQDLVPHA